MTRSKLAASLFTALLALANSLAAQTTPQPDPFNITPPLASYALSSCGDLTVSDGVIDSKGFSSSVVGSTGNIVSNGNIKVSGGTVNGDATAGPGKTVTTTGSGTITGTKSSATTAYNCTQVDLAALTATLQSSNDDAKLPLTGQGKNAVGGSTHYEFNLSGGDTIHFPAGTYYFTKFTVSGGSVITLDGAVRILCTGSVSVSGGSFVNSNPYALRFWSSGTPFTISGGGTMNGFVYAPAASATISAAHLIGSLMAQTITVSGSAHVTRIIDDVRPQVAITAPANNAIFTDGSSIVVRGTASDDQTPVTLKVNGNAVTINGDGTWTTTLNLSGAGSPVTIAAIATDIGGNTWTTSISIQIIPPPIVTLVSPPSGALVKTRTVNLTGSAGTAASVTVNGQSATLAGGSWTLANFDLGADGSHPLTIVGTNAGGSSPPITPTPTITNDTTPPAIQGTITPTPNPDKWNNSDVTVTFACSDTGSGIATCQAPIIVSTEGAGQIVTGTAVDKAGNPATANVPVNLDKTVPHFTFTSHTNNQIVTTPQITISGGSDDAINATVNSIAATVNTSAKTFTSAPLTLVEKSNSITVNGKDIAGNPGTATINIVLDNLPPHVAITSPANNAVVSSDPAHVVVSGTSSDDQTSVTGVKVNDRSATLNADGTWTITLDLSAGSSPATITAVATDAAGNTANANISVVTIPPPVLSLISPAPNSLLNTRTVNLSGNAGTATTVTVNGQSATVASGGWTLANFDLGVDGAHTLTIVGTNAGGPSTITPSLTLDTTLPAITGIATPAANGAGWNNGDVTVTFNCSDSGSGIATCQTPITVSTEGASQTITGTATDKAGNSANAKVTLNIDKTAPVFTFTSHHDGQIVNTPQVVVAGGSNDAITATVNTQTATIDTAAKTFTSPTLTLTQGNNAIVVTGKDVADNSGTATITLNLDNLPPHVAITSPANNATVPDPKNVVISGTTSDDQTSVAGVDVNGKPATLATNGNWTITLDLSAAASPIDVTAVATDVAGNIATTKISVITLPPPTLTLTLPPPDSFVNVRTVALSGGAGSADSVTVNGQTALVANGAWTIASFDLGNDGAVPLTIVGTNAGGSTTITQTLFLDTVPPQIQAAVSPAPNASGWNNSNVTVTFTCVDSGSGSGIATCQSPITVSTEAAGQIITGAAVDKAGNSAAVRVTLNIDKTAPRFTFTSHTNNQIVTAPKVTIVGGSDDAIAATVNGVAAVIDPAAKTFTVTLTLVEGNSSIIVTGTDIAGNSGSATLTLVVDTKAPQVSITSPAANACLNVSALDIKGTASDANFKNITVQLGGTTVTPVVDASGNWVANFSNVPEGKALFTVTATDTVGHTATSSLAINIDRTAPAIAFTESGVPFAATLLNRAVTPFVRVTDADPAPTLTVTLDGAAYAAGTSIAAEGQHTLDAIATDCAGIRSEKSVQFTIDRTPPTLSNFTPANGAAIGTLPASIQGTASEPATISVGGGAGVQTDGSNNFTLAGVPFANGINKFILHAVDAAGNTSDTAYSVTVRTGAPIVTISDNGTPIASGTVFSRAVTPVITADSTDDTITAQLDSNTFTLGTAITADGNHILIATAKDPVGHTTNATVTFTIDRTAPTIKITSPADGATIDADSATIAGTAGDAVAVSVNGIAATLSSGNFTANVPLDPASTSIIAIGSDAAGNQGRDQITVNRAGPATGLVLTYPPEGMRTNRPATVVTGRVLTPSAVQSLTLEGHIASGQSTGTTQVTRDPSGSFTVTNFALFEGVDTITATTTTAAGKTSSAVVHVNVDLTPPTVQLLAGGTSLDDGAHFPGATTLTATAADAPVAGFTQDPTTVTLQIDGVAATQPATVSANGGHTAVAIATDGVGNQTRVQRSFFIGTTAGTAGCGLAGFDPIDGSVVTANSTTLVGRSGGAAGVKINGIPAQVANGMFSGTVELSQEGANSVTIVCTDASGAPTGTPATITLNRVTAAPSITIDSPAEGVFVGTDTITVGGTVQNASSVDVNGAAAAVTGSTYSVANVRLAAGLNILVAHARNAAGAVAIASRRVIYLKNPPTISITWPSDGFSTGATTIDVSGTYTNLDPTSLQSSPAGTMDPHPWSDTTGYFVIHGVPLAGTQPITVTGHDALNNPVSVTVNVTKAAGAPSITITSPANNSYLPAGTTIPATGAFNGPTGSLIDVNGTTATADFTAFTYSGTAPFAASGPTIITAHLSQPDGNAAIATVIVNQLAAAPSVKAVFPDSGASATDPGVMVLVSFSAPMDEGLLRGAFSLVDASNNPVTGQFRLEKDILSFAPATTLTPGAAYTIDIKTSAKDLAGNALATEYTSKFTIATSAPTTPPTVNPVAGPLCASSVAISGTAPAGSRIEVDLNGVPTYATTDSTGNYTATLTIPQVSGYDVARVRIIGADGTFSPSAPVSFQVDCSGAQVLGATYDRTANAISVTFSKAIDVSSVTIGPAGSTQLALNDGTQLSGTVAAGSSASSILITPSAPSGTADPRTSTVILTITTGVKDTTGRNLTTPFGQTFTASGQPQQTPNDGTGYISGQILDATNGRLLGGASVSIDVPVTALKSPKVSATSFTPLHGTAKVASTSDSTGHYTSRLPEGAYAIHASANGYTDVYRQVVVPAGQGIIPIDIRLTRRGSTATTAGSDLTLTHGGDDTLTRKATLTIPSAAAASGTAATLTAVGGQGLPGLLPLGWSPLAAAEIHLVTPAATPMGAATASLTFQLSNDVATSGRTISAVIYDATRDAWDVVQPVVSIGSNGIANINVSLPATSSDSTGANSGTAAIALVYPDIAPYAAPPAPVAGGSLTGVADPCAAGTCPPFTAKSFTLNPPIVTPNQRTVATLVIDGSATTTPQFPSGTAIDALVNEELRLVDGSILTDQPFSTDLILYRSLDTKSATADFHLAPSAKASQVTLQIGFDHIQILPYPGRLDRGTLIGPAGGRVPSDEQVQINIPTGATAQALHATASSMTTNDFAQFGSIDGFQIVGGFTLTLDPATTTQQPFASMQLIKPANVTFTVDPAVVGSTPQLILAEVVPQTTFGRIFRLADPMAAPLPIEASTLLHVTTATINAATLPVDGIIRPGQYLLLLARQPIAFATGTVSLSSGTVVAGAAVVSSSIGVRDLSRTTGIYNVPVIAKPGAPFALTPLHPSLGDGVPYTATAAPDPAAIVPVGLTFAFQPPALQSVTVTGPQGGINLVTNNGAVGISVSTGVQAVFSQSLDPASVTPSSITVISANGQTVKGTTTASGPALTWTLAPGTALAVSSNYSVQISGTVRGAHGAPLGSTAIYTFSSVTQITSAQINASKIRITIPDANGISTIIGDPGALPTVPPEANVWSTVALRRGNAFITQYQAQAHTDGSFSITIGTCGGSGNCADSVTIKDHIDLEILNAAQNIAAIIPMTPFVTADGLGVLAASDTATDFTTKDGVTIHVPAGAFAQPTVVHVVPSDKQPLEAVPSFDHDLAFAAGVNLQFDGIANKRIDIEIPVPAGFTPPTNELMLGWLGQSSRGPRIMIVDTIRMANNKFTTVDDTVTSNSAHRPTTKSVIVGRDVKKYLLGVERSGIYAVVDITVPIASGFAIFDSMQKGYDLFWDTLASLYAADFYMVEGRGRIAIPVLAGTPFTIEGVDTSTGFTMFKKQYPNADSGVIESPNPDVTGPYPVFATPSNVQQVDLVDQDTYVRNFYLQYNGTQVSIGYNPNETTDTRLPEGVRVQALNTANGESLDPVAVQSDGTFNLGVLTATKGDRIILISGAGDVTAGTDMSVVFNEPIDTSGDLHSLITLTATSGTTKIDLTSQLAYDVDSASRRIRMALPSGQLIAGARYDITLKKEIKDLTGNVLGIGVLPGTTTPHGGNRDLVLSFHVRDRAAVLGQFDIAPSDVHTGGTVRDMTQWGGLLFISALDGGLLAYDMANPAALKPSATGAQPKPLAFVPAKWTDPNTGQSITPGFDEHWAVATDRHGRVWATGFMSNFAVLRSYRVEDFLTAAGSTASCSGSPNAPAGSLCTYHGSAIIGWRPGYSASLDLASGTLLSDRVEATPRKMQVVLQDDEEPSYTFDTFKSAYSPSLVEAYPNNFERWNVNVTYSPNTGAPYYLVQRITIENTTRDLRWSVDVPAGQTVQVLNVVAQKGDQIKVYRNQRTWGVVSQFGYGISIFDLNAIDSNSVANKPAGYKDIRTQIIVTSADAASSCYPMTTFPGQIQDLTLSPEAALIPTSDSSALVAYATDVHNGVLGVGVDTEVAADVAGTTKECIFRNGGLVFYDRTSGSIHPRLAAIKTKFTSLGRFFNVRYGSVAYYHGLLAGKPADYVLISAGDLGLLAIQVGPPGSSMAGPDQLAGVIWVPQGVYGIRVIPNSHLATVVDGSGRALIVDLTNIDERYDANGNLTTGLFKTASDALNATPILSGLPGIDDARIVWASDPGFMQNTMPPVVDPNTGILIAGDLAAKSVRVIPAIDPKIRMMIDRGDAATNGLTEVEGVAPLGFDPKNGLLTGSTGSAAAFRIAVSLPAGAAKALQDAGSSLEVAVESEWTPGVETAQTTVQYPKAHLRTKDHDGAPDPRATTFVLHRDLPSNVEEQVRYQSGATRYVSDWIVAIGDPRASEKWKWPSGTTTAMKATAGCASCDRPATLHNQTEQQHVYELWTAGRYITVRPDGAIAANVLAGTPYAYLGKQGRLTARFTTTRARKVRATEVLVPAQNPPVADGMLQETHYVHSGEVETSRVDLDAGGRAGVNVVIARHYRSRTIGGTELGEGWDSPMFRFVLPLPNGDVEYHDGSGEIWKFKLDPNTLALVAPRGLFLKLIHTPRGYSLLDQKWRIAEFNDLGQLVSESDEFYSPAQSDSGNIIRYLYDEKGKMTRIIDPLGRTTKLTYENDRLSKVDTEWRHRSLKYDYDDFGRLIKVELPEVKAGAGVPAIYDHSGNKRPVIQYVYLPSLTPPQPNEPLQSQTYTDFAEFLGNLFTITDPEQVASGGQARVTFQYDLTTGTARDHNLSQTWASGETAYFEPDPHGYVDVLGQKRNYTLTDPSQYDGRLHITSKRLLDVPLMDAAASGLPDIISPQLTTNNHPTLETQYLFNNDGLITLTTYPNKLVEHTENWISPNGAPGSVLASKKAIGPLGDFIETSFGFDSASNATANLSQIGRRDNNTTSFIYRDSQTPSRGRTTIETNDTGVQSRAIFNKNGQIEHAENGTGTGNTSIQSVIEYYPPSTSNPIESGRPWHISRGNGDIHSTTTYSMSSDGVETEVTTDDIRGVVTTIVKDVDGNVVFRKVQAPSTTTALGASPSVTEETFGYNADGKLAYQTRVQNSVQIVTTLLYDALDRQVGSETTGVKLLGSPTVSGSEIDASLKTKTKYDLASRQITEFAPFRVDETSAPRTITTLDGLGRATLTQSTSPSGSLFVKKATYYDLSGKKAYETDFTRSATLTQNDPFGRPIAAIHGDGTRTQVAWDAWDEPIETIGFKKKSGPTLEQVSHSRSIFTADGRLRLSTQQIDAAGRSRGTGMSWQLGDAITTKRVGEIAFSDAAIGPSTTVRVQQTVRDSAGRVTDQISGEATGPEALLDPSNTFAETRVTNYLSDLAMQTESREPRAGRKSETTIGYDGLGRPILTIEGGGAYTSSAIYDEAGNALITQSAGMQPVRMQYDSRGLLLDQRFGSGKNIHRIYDELGTLRQYIDETTTQTTFTDVDELGRVTKTRYPDGTTEETVYENGTGVIQASRDRAGRWVWFKYDDSNDGRLIEEDRGGNGATPVLTSNPFIRYSYDDASRITRIASADAAIEYDNFDLMGRPQITRTIRYKKTGCIPAIVSCGAGLVDPAQIAEVYTQGHVWSVFDGERSRWRLPVAGSSLPTTEVDTAWRNWIDEQRDSAGNLVRQQEAVAQTGTAGGDTVSQAIARGVGRLAQRQRGNLLTRFGYADAADASTSAVVPTTPPSPGAPLGGLGRAESLIGTRTIAGSEITLGPKKLIESAKDLGLDARNSSWQYTDDRGWLFQSILLQRDGATANLPAAGNSNSDAALVTTRDINPSRLGATDLGNLPNPSAVVPLTWTADQIGDGNQIKHRNFSTAGLPEGDQTFTWTGGRRESNGAWTLSYDDRGRVVAKESIDRRIVYDYDPNDRVVGRIAYQKDASGTWTIETRTNVLARDGLPAETTFVWDPLADRLVAMFDSAAVRTAATLTAETGLLRQYVHGESSYDDPVEVLIAAAAGQTPQHFLPILDEAGTGSLQAIADASGKLVERVLYADSYGDAPRYLQGAVADHLNVINDAGARTISIHFTEAVDATTVATGAVATALDASGNSVATLSTVPSLTDAHTVTWKVDSPTWTTFTQGAQSIRISVTNALRFTAWGTTPLQPVADWETVLGRASSLPGVPFVKTAQLADFDATQPLYDVPDLYLVGRTTSVSNLLFDFHGLPFRDPADGLIFARARWYDPSTSSFVSDDPLGYKDSSNLYAYAANNPVGRTDPTGESWSDVWDVTKAAAGVVAGTVVGVVETSAEMVKGAFFATYNGVGAMAYQATGNEMYRAQYDAHMRTTEAINNAVSHPINAAQAMWSGIKQPFEQAAAAGDTFQVGFEMGKQIGAALAPIAAEKAVGALSDGLLAGARTGTRIAAEAEMEMEARSARAATASEARVPVSQAESAMMEEASGAEAAGKRVEPCPYLLPSCLIGSTAITTPNGMTPIEDLHVGDRVASTFIDSSRPDGWTAVDSVDWHVVKLRMTNPQNNDDRYEIEMLRPVEWIVAHEAYPGHTIELATERNAHDQAYVIGVAPAPHIAPGAGRVVLATYAHQDEIVSIRFAGAADPVDSSPWHRFYSRDRIEWVDARNLRVGERIRTKSGESAIAAIDHKPGAARVFDLEVEGDHAYYVADAQVLTHNCGDFTSELEVSDNAARRHLRRALGEGEGQAHHVIPWETRTDPFMESAARGGFNINGPENGIRLESGQHMGSHPRYNAAIQQKLERLGAQYGGTLTDAQAAEVLRDYAAQVRKGLMRSAHKLR